MPGLGSTTQLELSRPETFSIGNVGGGTTDLTAIVEIWDLPSQPWKAEPRGHVIPAASSDFWDGWRPS